MLAASHLPERPILPTLRHGPHSRGSCLVAQPHPPELLHILMHPDLERAKRIGEFLSYPQSRTFAKLLIDCEDAGCCGRCS